MSGPSPEPWSNNPYAPGISYSLYISEKANLAGILIGATLYGMSTCICVHLLNIPLAILGVVIILFFRCLGVLFSPANHTQGCAKWGLAIHTTVMFSLTTISTAMSFNLQSISYIDNLEFSSVDGFLPPGPVGYQLLIYSKAIDVVPNVSFMLNNWLADGLLVGCAFGLTPQTSHRDHLHSSTVAMSFTSRTTGPLPSHA